MHRPGMMHEERHGGWAGGWVGKRTRARARTRPRAVHMGGRNGRQRGRQRLIVSEGARPRAAIGRLRGLFVGEQVIPSSRIADVTLLPPHAPAPARAATPPRQSEASPSCAATAVCRPVLTCSLPLPPLRARTAATSSEAFRTASRTASSSRLAVKITLCPFFCSFFFFGPTVYRVS